jgi:alkanesulfonate monooxygenase SsuD/methylene tetrahydromethanopterin reductase-like flavin-dependent oxidoreductase (luciferase family)
MLPLVRQLWEGDVAHEGDFWAFPTSTSCPKPVQAQVPMWVAARSPITFDYAVANDCHIMCWPLTLPINEAEKYRAQLDDAIAKAGGTYNGTFALMRHTAVYEDEADRRTALDAIRSVLGKFGNLMTKTGEVRNGFPDEVALDELDGNVRVDPVMLEKNLAFGSPEQVIAKLNAYKALGVDAFIYYASMGLGMEQQKRSLQLFIDHVLPEFT